MKHLRRKIQPQAAMSAPTLSDIEAMEMHSIPVGSGSGSGYRDTPQDEENVEEDDDHEVDEHMMATSSQTIDPALKRHSHMSYIFIGVAAIILLTGLLRVGKGGSSKFHNARTKAMSDDLSSSSNTIIEFTVANLRTNSENCTHVGKMLQCIPQHNDATNKFRIQLHEEWAPIGVKRFQDLTKAKFWDDVRIFRVVPNFVSQFGISSYPDVEEYWDSLGNLKDDEVIASNKRGTVTFATAGPNTRTTQVFINTADNKFLDKQGFSPIGEVLPAGNGYGGMEVVDEIYSKYGEDPDQGMIEEKGKDYLEKEFPLLSYFVTAVFV